jgi:regulator of protease activity HflC (stomatin/prohibitin superfamily)
MGCASIDRRSALLALMASAIAFAACRAEPAPFVEVEFDVGEIITSDQQRAIALSTRAQFVVVDEAAFRLFLSDAHLRSYLQAAVHNNTRNIVGNYTLDEVLQPEFMAQKVRGLVDRDVRRYGLAIRELSLPFRRLRVE